MEISPHGPVNTQTSPGPRDLAGRGEGMSPAQGHLHTGLQKALAQMEESRRCTERYFAGRAASEAF